MKKAIAVFLQEGNELVAFNEATTICIFTKESAEWKLTAELPVIIDFNSSMKIIREEIKLLISELEDCRIIAGKNITGIPYSIFDKEGFHIFNINEVSDETLNSIITDINTSELEKINILNIGRPAGTSIPGEFFFDLSSFQEKYPTVSSKQILQPFFNETPFIKLELKCDHIPPWINQSGYEVTAGTYENKKIKAVIQKKLCVK